MEKEVIRRILISEVLKNQEEFNAATQNLVSTTKEDMGGKFKLVFGVFGALALLGLISLIVITIYKIFNKLIIWS